MIESFSVNAIKQLWNPFECAPWAGCQEITRNGILDCLNSGTWEEISFSEAIFMDYFEEWYNHEARIATIIRDQIYKEPILIDSLDAYWPIIDGNHRLAAVIYLDLPSIDAYYSGCVDTKLTLLY